MRKIFILILLFFTLALSSCNTNINSSIYISSIGFEIKDDKLVTYFLSNPLTDAHSTNILALGFTIFAPKAKALIFAIDPRIE